MNVIFKKTHPPVVAETALASAPTGLAFTGAGFASDNTRFSSVAAGIVLAATRFTSLTARLAFLLD